MCVICFFVDLECLPSDDRSGGEDFSRGGHFPPTNMEVVAVVAVVMVAEGDMEVLPPLGGHQDFEADLTEGVAFEDTGHPLEDTAELGLLTDLLLL